MELSRGRDLRKRGWFWLDDEYLNGYAKHLGVTASCVYISLCRHVNKDQTCFPSMEKIAEELGLGSRNTVSIAIQKLAQWKIVEIKEEIDEKTKRRKNNIYLLLDKEYWIPKPCTEIEHGKAMPEKQAEPCPIDDKSHARIVSSKETHINNTQIKETQLAETSSAGISLLLKEFEKINPACSKYYGNKTQRDACQFLIDTYSFNRVKMVIEKTLPKTNGMAFFPTIGTPVQLRDRWTALESAIRKHQNKVDSKRKSIAILK